MASAATEVFVSYKAEDRARLSPLVEALEAEGFTVWWDAHIGGGTNWHEDIEQHLDAAKCVIVAWSKRSIGHDGHFVRDEARRAQRRDAYIPVCLDAVEPPLGFGEIQALPLKGWKGDRADPRFRALADAVQNHVSGEHIAHPHAHFHQPRVSRREAVAGGIGIGAIAVAGTGGWLLLKPGSADAKRIAVLPFANLSGSHEQSYFSDGIAEELRTALSRIGLEVIGRSSSDAVKDLDTKAAAVKLGVANILTGSVRRSAETIRINAQLVSGKDGVERWAQSYDRAPGDAIKIQSDIAASVAQALSIALGQAGRAALALGGTADSAAQDLLLQARKLRREASGPEAARKSLLLLDAALARDPNYADAYVEKADAHFLLGSAYPTSPSDAERQLAQAEVAARRAMMLAPKLGSAYAVLAYVDQSRLDFAGSLRNMSQALALSPEDPNVLTVAPRILPFVGDGQEALRLADRLIALDPLNGPAHRRKAEVLGVLRRYPQSIEAARTALELAPNGLTAHWWIGNGLTLLGKHAQARAAFQRLAADEPFRLIGEALVAARTGDAAGAKQMMERIESMGGTWAYQYAEIYAQIGDRDRAFAELGNAIEAKDPGLMYLKKDPFLDPIRDDPRYAALLSRLNFP